MLFTDTDSLVYEITGKDVYKDFYKDKDLFHFREYPSNKNVIGKMKDEFKGKIIYEFAGLKSKMYSLISIDDKKVTKAKGINRKNKA